MSSYHSSFSYLGTNTAKDKNLIIATFEPDDGDHDTFLSMTPSTDEFYNGTKKFDYGAKYDTTAAINITLIKSDGSDFSVAENRDLLRWLTGSRVNSWLDFYEGDEVKYAFLGRVTDVKQRKLDARIIGLVVTFTSVHPWAYSELQTYKFNIGENIIEINNEGYAYMGSDDGQLDTQFIEFIETDDEGIVYNAYLNITDDGIVYADDRIKLDIDNQTDDLYTYVYLDTIYKNTVHADTGTVLTIQNSTSGETTSIEDIFEHEVITLNAGQFITSNQVSKIFGDTFNFHWPRLIPGVNNLIIDGTGKATMEFNFRYPIKIGDCAVDINNIINNPVGCNDYIIYDPWYPTDR